MKNIDAIITEAHKAYNIYKDLNKNKKADFLEAIGRNIKEAENDLVETAMQETHLAKPRLQGELQRTVNQTKLFAELIRSGSWVNAIIDTANNEKQPPKPDIRQMQIPLGVVGVFGASNFPFAYSVAGGDTISALAAGCPVVYKLNPGHPETSKKVANIMAKVIDTFGLPKATFTMLEGQDYETGNNLVSHPLIKAIGFTGSFKGGKALYDVAAKRKEPIPFYAEMGSVNPVFILPQMLKQKSAELADALVTSNQASLGQFCTNPGVILSQRSDDQKNFEDHFSALLQKSSSGKMLAKNISQNYTEGIATLKQLGANEAGHGTGDKGDLLGLPEMLTANADAVLNNADLLHEVFGPGSLHVAAENKEQLLEVAVKLEGQLTATIWGTDEDMNDYKELLVILIQKAGRLIFNGVPTGVEVTAAMVHGGPFPATTDSRSTSVGTNAIYRFTRPVCFQNFPDHLLPEALQNNNPLQIMRSVNGSYTNSNG